MSKTTSAKFKVSCKCGKKYLVRSDLAGRTVKCRNCHEELQLKRRAAKEEPMWCPDCFSRLDRKDPVCSSCKRKNEGYIPAPIKTKETPGILSILAAALINLLPQNPVQRTWVIICALIVFVMSILQIWCSGLIFLLLYFCLGVGLAITCICARVSSQLTLGRVLIGILTYESVGVIRIAYGFSHGMQQFALLILMMLGGPFILLFFAYIGIGRSGYWSDHYHHCSGCGSSWGSHSGHSCGSSCGGDSGGGGCGGCGGD